MFREEHFVIAFFQHNVLNDFMSTLWIWYRRHLSFVNKFKAYYERSTLVDLSYPVLCRGNFSNDDYNSKENTTKNSHFRNQDYSVRLFHFEPTVIGLERISLE